MFADGTQQVIQQAGFLSGYCEVTRDFPGGDTTGYTTGHFEWDTVKSRVIFPWESL
jgi:hypothetical protein